MVDDGVRHARTIVCCSLAEPEHLFYVGAKGKIAFLINPKLDEERI
jgi:hypothetical protein